MRGFYLAHKVHLYFCLLLSSFSSFAQDVLDINIVDVGAGSCTVVTLPQQNGLIVFDAGYWHGKLCYSAVKHSQSKSTNNSDIKLMIISHSDADHLGDAASILSEFKVLNLVRTGFASSSKSWKKFDQAASNAEARGTQVFNASHQSIVGTQFRFDDILVSILYGKARWDGEPLSTSEAKNAVSVVAKLEYAGRAILFPGDTVGRDLGGAEHQCAYAEEDMVSNSLNLSLKSDLLLAPHHGSDSSSSICFIKAVDPQYVIFQAGHKHGHPTITAKNRYLAAGVKLQNIFRTDRGDAENSPYDWESDDTNSCIDKAGDDGIHISITAMGKIDINYNNPEPSVCL